MKRVRLPGCAKVAQVARRGRLMQMLLDLEARKVECKAALPAPKADDGAECPATAPRPEGPAWGRPPGPELTICRVMAIARGGFSADVLAVSGMRSAERGRSQLISAKLLQTFHRKITVRGMTTKLMG
jgi:hypothetical protein